MFMIVQTLLLNSEGKGILHVTFKQYSRTQGSIFSFRKLVQAALR